MMNPPLHDEEDIIKTAYALSNPTRLRIIRILQKQAMTISEIAVKLDQTEANASTQVKILEQAGIITAEYSSGQHGLKKMCSLAIDKIEIDL
jgi:predicted transcriptional regulator